VVADPPPARLLDHVHRGGLRRRFDSPVTGVRIAALEQRLNGRLLFERDP